jgi:leucyl-tRNA synthetase
MTMQRNWIGRSEGAEFDLPVVGRRDVTITIFTTRPDTAFGMTYAVLAPEHPLVDALVTDEERARVAAFKRDVAQESEIERLAADRPKRGLRLEARAVNPFNGQEIPLFIADYVLMGYGTGAIMAVPGEDQRDWDFAKEHRLPVIATVKRPPDWEDTQAYTGDGVKINSGFLDGLGVNEAKRKAIDWLVERGLGKAKVNYRLRDWGISRQRYWGAPIPILYCDTCGMVPEREENLPVVLPQDVQISGKGGSPLASVQSFVNARCPKCGGNARRDTDTMDTFVESSWYFLRYCSPSYEHGMFERQAAEYWMPVDQYIGGIEHAVLHLLYARFYTKVLRDLDMIAVDEPFTAQLSQGMVVKDGAKMSKSKGNVVDPDDLIRRYGADTARLFSLFAAPPEKDLDWNDHGVEGASRFLNRLWRFVHGHLDELKSGRRVDAASLSETGRACRRVIHVTIQRVTEDIENDFHFNTAISAVMELVNALVEFERTSMDTVGAEERAGLLREAVDTTLLLLGPVCPHITEELWKTLGHGASLFKQPWPSPDQDAMKRDEVQIVVQVDGKVRSRLMADVGLEEAEIRQMALADGRVLPWLNGRQVAKVVVVPGRLVNIVTRA